MQSKHLWIVVTMLYFTIPQLAYSKNVTGFDLVTMKNGDIHHGTVAHEKFLIETAAGAVSVPYIYVLSLRMGSEVPLNKLITVQGEQFSGQIQGGNILILRDQAPALPLHLDDIAQIDFATRHIKNRKTKFSDGIVLQNGDRFWGKIRTENLILDKQNTFQLENIHLLDIESRMDGELIMAQMTSNNGNIRQFEIVAKSIVIDTTYGQSLDIPVSQLSTLAFQVRHHPHQTGFDFRRKLNPANLIRDPMSDGDLAPEMISLRGGVFIRGDLQGNGDSDEAPPKQVNLPAFAIGIYEISFDEYDHFCEDTRREKPDDGDWGRGARPVINVSWKDAVAYTRWLSRKTRQNYRLPTDAEWEYAARAASQTRFWWGNEVDSGRANCEGCGSLWDGEKTAPVGKFSANGFGLHDTAGNVFEWVADCYHDTFANAPADGSALDKPGCGKRVIRGGAWSFPAKEIRSANRWRDFPTRRSDDTGFRVVRELGSSR